MGGDKPSLVDESLEDYQARLQWFDEAELGLFIHFGLYAIPAGEWKGEKMTSMKYAEWIQGAMDIPREEYAELTKEFNPEQFNADLIVRTAKEAGLNYLVITSKHHDGFCLWDSAYTEFDVASTPFAGRDILAELNAACQRHGLKFGLYYSIIDWNHASQEPNFENPRKPQPSEIWGKPLITREGKQEYAQYMTDQLLELIERYDPAVLWFDGDWTPWWKVWDGIRLYNTLRAASPHVIINHRIGTRNRFEADFRCAEQRLPRDPIPMHWEGCMTLNKSWGYKKDDNNWKTAEEVYGKIAEAFAKGGNMLLNVGPDADGVIQPEAVQILLDTGKLLEANPLEKQTAPITVVPGMRNKPRTGPVDPTPGVN